MGKAPSQCTVMGKSSYSNPTIDKVQNRLKTSIKDIKTRLFLGHPAPDLQVRKAALSGTIARSQVLPGRDLWEAEKNSSVTSVCCLFTLADKVGLLFGSDRATWAS